MLPSLLANDIQTGLKQFLMSAYEPADSHSHGLMSRFVENQSAWLKGPFIQLGLPFLKGNSGRDFFSTFQTRFPGYTHQERAWERLASNRLAASTLVATGTGSGKSECFLYPMLDHVARARSAGEEGVKALVIYPMNALATDQARRIAELVAAVPAFMGLRVGLYVGGTAGAPGDGMTMTPNAVITDRDTLRQNPPDVLLTNYKMLDYLMLRPKDRQLWSRNTPTTLRYVVVDELHTFDGAQGTDLALLLRRLRARLAIPKGYLICAGTSATLGGSSDTSPLREYARQIFGEAFPPESVITETRESIGDFLGDAPVDFMFAFQPSLVSVLDPHHYTKPEAAVAAWFQVFFPEVAFPEDVTNTAWRQQLGRLLKQHQLFVNLIKRLKGSVIDQAELIDTFARYMPSASHAQVAQVLDALLVLVAWALAEDGQPLVTQRVQLWVRELRRMVGRVEADSEGVTLVSDSDLPAAREGVYLPLVQCSQCRTTGWVSRRVEGSNRLSVQLDEIYNTWFSKRPEAARFYAATSVGRSHVEGIHQQVCTGCGAIQQAGEACLACGHQSLLRVFMVTANRTQVRGQAQFTLHDTTCPACGEADELLLLGARNATLGSQVVDSSWASVFNDDKKLIAFSDSVQDAAHRAGFFGARTYLNNVRTALCRVIDEMTQPRMSWHDFQSALERQFSTPGSAVNLPAETFVAEFIAPNMTWQHDWSVSLLQKGQLPSDSKLPGRVRKRFLWQAVSEFTYLSQRGRTLERIGKATLAPDLDDVREAAVRLLPILQEQYGLRGLQQQTVLHWLWGLLTHLRRRGGVMHPELGNYASDGNVFALVRSGGRSEWLPVLGERTPRPIFLTDGNHRDFDKLTNSRDNSWYDRWTEATLVREALTGGRDVAAELNREALKVFTTQGVLVHQSSHQGSTWALNPDRLFLHTDLAFLATVGSKRRQAVPTVDARDLLGMPCLDAPESHYEVILTEASSWWAARFSRGDVRRVIAAEHTGLLERPTREALEGRFKSKAPQPWFENLLSATPTLEMGVDIGDLSSVLLCSVPPNQASFLQRIGRAGRRDGNAMTTTLADGSSPHDLYFFEEIDEMLSGDVAPPGIFLKAAEVLRRQLFAFCMDDWVAQLKSLSALPEKTSQALDAVEQARKDRFPYLFCDHVTQHEQRLLGAFLSLLADDLDDEVRARLTDFMQGQGESVGLKIRLLNAFQELVEERRTYKKRKDELDKVRAKLQQRPQDDATRAELDELQRERDKLLELIGEINSRDLLNTLTDAGLIPNYAFPESGIELKSVLWRKRASDEPGNGAYVTVNTFKYERPAQSALSEFAPENRFYANQRRVEVDQINMSLAKTEDWRFCPSCHHMQNLTIHADVHATCPRCGDGMWADAAQRRTLLRFKQAIANSDDTKVRIDDSADDREPKHYVRQLMADFQPEHVREAWRIPGESLPFGFEFISRVTFRDVNFGELAKPGESFKVADKETARPGFKLCRHCGKVQKPSRRSGEQAEQQHTFDCPQRETNDPKSLLECLYLYREFESEALRILVPYTKSGVDDRVVQSFMAAMQLGLKKRFGGKVDHLRMVMQDEPGKDGGPRRFYVMLYDSVPGGTGYLHQLLAKDAGTLADVLKLALQAVSDCRCVPDPEKDGCYRCLYQYRLGRNMAKVSRQVAASVLTELVDSLDQMERVETISDIYINPLFDSVLEAKFIESLSRLSGQGGLPVTKVVPDIVNGKSGYVLEVGGQRYRIEPQRDITEDDGVSVASRPDFIIWPWASHARRRPVAVFCDGWAFHKQSLAADALKRSALVASGRFWTWSVTHQDIQTSLKGDTKTDLDSLSVIFARHSGATLPKGVVQAQSNAFLLHSVTRLLQWLALPAGKDEADPAMLRWQRDALWLAFLMVPNTPEQRTLVQSQWLLWKDRMPAHAQGLANDFVPALSKQEGVSRFIAHVPLPVLMGTTPLASPWAAPGVMLLDESLGESEEVLHQAWRVWLHAYNTLQFLPGLWLMTASLLDSGQHASIKMGQTTGLVVPGMALSEAWEQLLTHLLTPMVDGMKQLAMAGVGMPDLGLELADDKGRAIAESEMSWADARCVVLRDDQADMSPEWQAAGWTTLLLDESLSQIDGQPWVNAVAAALGMTLALKEI